MIIKAACAALAVFVLSGVWLLAAWLIGNQTKDWTPVAAIVVDSEVQRERRRFQGWSCTVNYSVDGVEYASEIDKFPFGSTVVYVDPNDPTSVVGRRGATMQSMFIPLITGAVSGLFGILLALIAISPKDD